MMNERERLSWSLRAAAAILGTLGVAILGFWAFALRKGFLTDGLQTVENNSLAVFHVAAEAIMGIAALVGAWGIITGRAWGPPIGLAALGMVVYATVNSLSHSVKNDPSLTPVFLVSLLLALIGLALLLSGRRPRLLSR
jgi:MYXO-CTERM domain-containing protein